MVGKLPIVLWIVAVLLCGRVFGFPLPYELDIGSEEDLVRYYEEGYFEGTSLEDLLSLYRDKVNLNTATLSELRAVPYMSEKEARRIREFCRKRVLFSLNQLLAENLVSRRSLSLIRPFVRAGWIRKVKGSLRTHVGPGEVSSCISFSVGPLESEIRGDYRDRAEATPGEEYRLNRISRNVAAEDWFVTWKRDSLSLTAGSFKAQFAQGLVVCGGSLRSPQGIRGETGSREYFKGAALEFSRSSFRSRILFSGYKQDMRIPLLMRDGEAYDYFQCDDLIPVKSIGGEVFWRSGSAGASLLGLYHEQNGEVFRLGGAGWSYHRGSFSCEGEAATDGERWAWQTSLSHQGKLIEGEVLFYENRGVTLPLADPLRERLDSYWEGTVRKSFPRGRVSLAVRSYNGKGEEEDNLKYRLSARWFPCQGISLEALRYHYQMGLYYTSLKLKMKKGSWRPSLEYRLYYSRAQKIYLGLGYRRYPLRMSLDLRYGGAYGWDKTAVLSGSYHLGRHLFLSGRYRYDWPCENEGSRWSVYVRTSL
jgi:hypothetical protein